MSNPGIRRTLECPGVRPVSNNDSDLGTKMRVDRCVNKGLQV